MLPGWSGRRGAILFIGNSGSGKTTQARLWQSAGGRLAGNHRTLLRKTDGWQTCSYFEDGDPPGCDPARVPLKAVQCLREHLEQCGVME